MLSFAVFKFVVKQTSAEAENPLKEMTSSAVLLMTPSQLLEGMASNPSDLKADDFGTHVHASSHEHVHASSHEHDCGARLEPTIPAEDLGAAASLLAVLKKNLLTKASKVKSCRFI